MKSLVSFLALVSFSISVNAQQVTNLNDSGPGSLRQAVFNANSGDVIRFDPSLIANGSDTLKLAFTIGFAQGVTLKGLYNQTDTLYISGSDSVQLFYMDFNGNPGQIVVLDSLVLINGYSNVTGGGAVYISDADSVSISSSVIRSNTADGDFDGGALHINAGAAQYDNLQLASNRLINVDMTLPITEGHGGGLYSHSSRANYFMNSSVSNNYTDNLGGGISLEGGSVQLKNSHFSSNSALQQGGGAAVRLSLAIIEDCTFELDSAHLSAGGGLYAGSCPAIIVKGCVLRENYSNLNGGGIMCRSVPQFVSNSTFISNYSSTCGGAATTFYGDTLSTFINCSFIGNRSGSNGGAICSFYASTSITNSTFYDNYSPNGSRNVHALNDTLEFGSSIIHSYTTGNIGGNSFKVNHGYNVFSDSTGIVVPTDQTNVDTATLALGPLQLNGGSTPTMLPRQGSPAINMGNPTDFSDVQNGPIFGRRDVGAAETQVVIYDTTNACGTVNWWGNTYSQAGTYTDTAFNANSIDSVGVLVLEAQDTSIYDLDGSLYSNETDPNTAYQWVDCDNNYAAIQGATNINFLPPSNGSYAVILTNQNCIDTSSCFNYNRFSTPENSAGSKWLTFFPNPTNGIITLSTEGTLPQSYELLDLSGRIVHRQTIESRVIQLPNVGSGIYLIRWVAGNGSVQVDRVSISY